MAPNWKPRHDVETKQLRNEIRSIVYQMIGLTNEVWVQIRHGRKPCRSYTWKHIKRNTPEHMAIKEKLEHLVVREGQHLLTQSALKGYRRWVLGLETDYPEWTERYPEEDDPAAFMAAPLRGEGSWDLP